MDVYLYHELKLKQRRQCSCHFHPRLRILPWTQGVTNRRHLWCPVISLQSRELLDKNIGASRIRSNVYIYVHLVNASASANANVCVHKSLMKDLRNNKRRTLKSLLPLRWRRSNPARSLYYNYITHDGIFLGSKFVWFWFFWFSQARLWRELELRKDLELRTLSFFRSGVISF